VNVELDPMKWAEQQFGTCNLGDIRRTRRLVRFAAQVAADPDGSTPNQTEKWSDLKAAYRLIDNENVSFEAVTQPHRQQALDRQSGLWLILDDTTEIDFGATNQAAGLGPLGQGFGRGFLLHSGLMVHPKTEDVVGLAGQIIHYRTPAPKNETKTHRLNRDRESMNWSQLVDQIGVPPESVLFVHVCDRAADNFEVYCHLLLTRQDWVIRAAHLNRMIVYHETETALSECLKRLPVSGTYELSWRTPTDGNRTAKVGIRLGMIMMPAPRHKTPWLKEQEIGSIRMNVIEVREVNAPKSAEPVHWVLLTSLPVDTFDEACTVIGYYEKRSMVEEFHKALKTGCRIEERQYETSGRLEAITGLLSVAAVRLLQLRAAARAEPSRPAEEIVPSRWIAVLRSLRPNRHVTTVRHFFREVAGLGGHMLRKCDGEPGWITIWRGFKKLHLAIRATHGYRRKSG
jgi:hypothetical protein